MIGQFYESTYNYNVVSTMFGVDVSRISELKSRLDLLASAIYIENKKDQIEDIRDASFYLDTSYLDFPYLDLGNFLLQYKPIIFVEQGLKDKARDVLNTISEIVIPLMAARLPGIIMKPVLIQKEGKKMDYYGCSIQRRIELMRFAQKNGFNKIALGHHLEDIIQMYLMIFFTSGMSRQCFPK